MRAPVVILAVAALAGGCGGEEPDRVGAGELPAESAARLRLSTPAFIDGSRLPERYTCDGAGDEPPMQAGTVPASTSELVLLVTDPDAPGGGFVHVTRYGLSPRGDGTVDKGGREGRNSAGEIGWTPPCPPRDDEAHRYTWSVYALRDAANLKAGASPAEVSAAVRDGVLARGTITATYDR